MKRILLLEDDLSLVNGLSFAFKKQGFQTDIARTLREAEAFWTVGNYDLLVLDVSLPDGTGFSFCEKVRQSSKVPIIFLTASDEETSIIMGLDMGGDDYITKPFNPVELIARVRSHLRRYMKLGGVEQKQTTLQVGGIALDDDSKQVTVDGEEVALTTLEYSILKFLMQSPGKVVSSAEIYRKVWKDTWTGSENTVAVHIRHLREKLEINPSEPRYIKVVWGKGYKLEGDRS